MHLYCIAILRIFVFTVEERKQHAIHLSTILLFYEARRLDSIPLLTADDNYASKVIARSIFYMSKSY